MAYSLTREGKSLLRSSTIPTSAEHSDLQSLLRSVALARYKGTAGQPRALLRGEYQVEMKALSVPKEKLDLSSPARMYRSMVSVRMRHQQEADLKTLSEFSGS